jgi:hypothetical protein
MDFSKWLLINESTANELFQSAVNAFPNTAKRQYAIDTINITSPKITPYKGMKTLFVKTLAQNEGKEYNPIIVFKNIRYVDGPGNNIVEVTVDDVQYFFEKPTAENNDVLLRCNCGDFFWRFNYFNHLDKSLQGRVRKKYEALYNPGSANPRKMPGMCKHIMKSFRSLSEIIGE